MDTRSETPEPTGSKRWRLLRHPADRGEGRGRFDAAAAIASALLEDRGHGPAVETKTKLEEAVRLHEEL